MAGFIWIVLLQPYFLGNLSWRKTQHFTHVHGHLQRANGDLWERPDCEGIHVPISCICLEIFNRELMLVYTFFFLTTVATKLTVVGSKNHICCRLFFLQLNEEMTYNSTVWSLAVSWLLLVSFRQTKQASAVGESASGLKDTDMMKRAGFLYSAELPGLLEHCH